MHPLIIPHKILLPVAVLGLLLMVLSTVLKLNHQDFFGISNQFLMGFATMCSIFCTLILLADAIKNKIKNPAMWVMALIFLGSLGSVLYLLNRDRILINRAKFNV